MKEKTLINFNWQFLLHLSFNKKDSLVLKINKSATLRSKSLKKFATWEEKDET